FKFARFQLGLLALALAQLLVLPAKAHDGALKQRLLDVERWLLLLNSPLPPDSLARIAVSRYDMVVVDDLKTQSRYADFDMAAALKAIRAKRDGGKRLALAYVSIGAVEDYRTYFVPAWKRRPPDWLIGADPKHWSSSYPVAYWKPDWRDILNGP